MSSIDDIATKQNYVTPSRYISGRIIEYDLKAANISILRSKGIISQERYEYLSNLPKIQREVEVGLMERNDYSIYQELQEGIKDAKKDLLAFNKINEDQVVRIANDAVYINTDIDLKYTQFNEYIVFRNKSVSDVFCKLYDLNIFCKFLDSGNVNIDIKGLDATNTVLEIHKDYMVSVIISTIALLERSGIQSAIDYLSEICKKYVRRELPIEFYREFNKECTYQLIKMNSFATFNIFQDLSSSDMQYIDINYNYSLLRELWSILLEIYTIRKR